MKIKNISIFCTIYLLMIYVLSLISPSFTDLLTLLVVFFSALSILIGYFANRYCHFNEVVIGSLIAWSIYIILSLNKFEYSYIITYTTLTLAGYFFRLLIVKNLKSL